MIETLNKMLTIFGVSIVLFFLKLLNGNRIRPFQGSYRHIAGGAKTLGRARGHQWRPYYLLVSEGKLPFEILPFFLKNVYISVFNSYFLDNRWGFSDMWPRFVTNQRTGSNKKRRLSLHTLTDV